MLHEDFKGHKGEIKEGDIQWMTAGKGIVHAEMPSSFENPSIGFQLWINLPSKDKFMEPRYQEFKASEISEVQQSPNLKGKVRFNYIIFINFSEGY